MQIKPAVQESTVNEAKERQERIRAKCRQMQGDWFEIGEMVKEGLERKDPKALGMNAHNWMVDLFGDRASVAKIYRSLRISKALEKLPEDTVKQLTEGKAYLLTQLKEKDREEYLNKALESTNEQFEEIVEGRREEYGIKREKRVHIGVSLEESAAELWNQAEFKVAAILELDIETKPGLRAVVFETIAALLGNTPYEVLRAEIVGSEEEIES